MFQHRRLVDARQTDIHIQHLGAGLGLGHRLGAGIGAVTVPQRLLQPLFAGGVDPLAHHRDAFHLHTAHRRTQPAGPQRDFGGRAAFCKGLPQQTDILRRGAAAPAHHRDAGAGIVLHLGGKPGGVQIIAAVGVGQPGIGLDKDRQIRRHHPAEPTGKRQDLGRAQRAVDADGRRPQPGRCHAETFHRAAGKGAAPAFEAHRGHHRQVAVFPGRQNGRLQLIEIGHGLKADQIRPGRRAGPHDLRKAPVGFLKGEGPGRDEQFPQGPHIQRHQGAGAPGTPSGAGHRSRHGLLHRVPGSGHLALVDAEGVGHQQISAGAGIVPVDGFQRIRHRKSRQLRFLARLQAAKLQLGPHTAVQDDEFFAGKQFVKLHRSSPSSNRHKSPAAGSGRSRPGSR